MSKPGKVEGGEHNFSGALSTWKEINLSELQKTLDKQGIELVDSQKESLLGRKALADKTKEFKKLPDEDKVDAIKGLLKAYQSEIDALTKRSKFSENAFLSVYKVFAEAPDPYPLLEAAVDQTIQLSEALETSVQHQTLIDENHSLKKRVAQLSNATAAKNKAEERAKTLESTMEDLIVEKVTQKENELNAKYDERLRNYEEREQDLHRQVTLTKTQLRDLRMSNESNQAKLLDHSSRQDQEVIQKLAEVDMIVADLDRANSRIATVERRNEILRSEIEALRTGSGSEDRVKSIEAQLATHEAETDRLSQALENAKAAAKESELALVKRVEEMKREVERKVEEVEGLKTKLKRFADYDEVKRELEIMKYVEFAGHDEDEEEEEEDAHLQLPNPNAAKISPSEPAKSLEALLAAKNKRILEELTKFRILHGALEASLAAAEEQLNITKQQLEKQQVLNEKLENDLLAMDQRQDGPVDEAKVDPLAGFNLGKKNVESSPSSVRSTSIPFAPSADTSILPIVTSQRDRFRQRNAELEEELRKQFQIISELRAEIKSLQADNLKLYEKVRYMQSYREQFSNGPGGRPLTQQLNPLPTSGPDEGISKYSKRYEEAMNPFEAFRGREATRAYQNLNAAERGVLGLVKAILNNRRARTFFMLYALALHLLVMFTTYECTTSPGTSYQKQPRPNPRL